MNQEYPGARIEFLCLLLLLPLYAWSQPEHLSVDEPSTPTIFQYIAANQIERMVITTDFTKLIAERNEDHHLDATVVMEGPNYFRETMRLKVQLRGRNRRLVCEMPPLKLDFSKKRLSERGLSEDGDKLKLVTHCADEFQDEYLLREYWAYRIYNQLTPVSFQVHLLRIRYIDTSDPEQQMEDQLAFLIESKEELANRFEGKDEDMWGLTSTDVDKQSYYNTVLFQYMIGNDDWSMESPHNLAFIERPDGEPPLIVPYDFDFSGLVNAPYARPNPKWGGFSVLDRVAMGAFDTREDLQNTLDGFLSLKNGGLNCFEECRWLSERTKKRMEKYLLGFYKQLENTRKIERIFVDGE
jgi:hypothetical protein